MGWVGVPNAPQCRISPYRRPNIGGYAFIARHHGAAAQEEPGSQRWQGGKMNQASPQHITHITNQPDQ